MRLAVVRARHARVGGEGRRGPGDVSARYHGDAVVVSAEAEVERAGAFVVGGLQGHDGEAEGGGEVLSVPMESSCS